MVEFCRASIIISSQGWFSGQGFDGYEVLYFSFAKLTSTSVQFKRFSASPHGKLVSREPLTPEYGGHKMLFIWHGGSCITAPVSSLTSTVSQGCLPQGSTLVA